MRSSSAAPTCARSYHEAVTAAEKVDNTAQPGSGLGFHSSTSENVEHGAVWLGFVDRGSPAWSGATVFFVSGSDVYIDKMKLHMHMSA